jgi:hypothetical protein
LPSAAVATARSARRQSTERHESQHRRGGLPSGGSSRDTQRDAATDRGQSDPLTRGSGGQVDEVAKQPMVWWPLLPSRESRRAHRLTFPTYWPRVRDGCAMVPPGVTAKAPNHACAADRGRRQAVPGFAGSLLTRRRRNRTFQAVGCTALLALKARWATRPLPPRGKRSPGVRPRGHGANLLGAQAIRPPTSPGRLLQVRRRSTCRSP